MTDSPYRAPGSTEDAPDISGDVRGMQIVTAGLLIGVTAFMVIAVVMTGGQFDTEPEFMFWFGLGFAAISFVVHLVVAAVIRRQQLALLKPEDIRGLDADVQPERLIGIYRGTHIIACALLEGAAFLNIICYLTEGFVGSLGVALLLALCILARFPTAPRIHSWIKNAAEDVALR